MDEITLKHNKAMGMEVPTCSECGGYGLGYASVEHHHKCTVAAGITEFEPILAEDEHWAWLGFEPRE